MESCLYISLHVVGVLSGEILCFKEYNVHESFFLLSSLI